jgi:hypothetical protein
METGKKALSVTFKTALISAQQVELGLYISRIAVL